MTLDAIAKAVPLDVINAVIDKEGVREDRERKLSMRATVLLCIAMNLFTHCSLGNVMRQLGKGLRFVFPDPDYLLPGDAAISYRRYQLGARPMAVLFRRVCRPMATRKTKGAFLFGLRLMAIDGTMEDVPDTAANAAAFGRPGTSKGRKGAFPQVLGVYLVECGTHAIVDAGFWARKVSERVGGFRLLRSVRIGMLVMWDRGFHSYDMVRQTRARGAHFVGRLPANVKPRFIRKLRDGSSLVELQPSQSKCTKGRKAGNKGERRPIQVRLIEYTITDPGVSGCGEKHRLITSLMNLDKYPAEVIACAYHERWECELAIDEMDTHQHLVGRPLRSKKPEGVIQEMYGFLIAHFAIRSLMHEAALQADLDPDRLSFTNALEVVRNAVSEFQMVPCSQQPRLYQRLLRDIAARPLPERRPRSNPRVVKRKMSNFKCKRPEGWPGYRKLPAFQDVVCVI